MEVVTTVGNAILSSFVEGMLDKLSSIMDWHKYAFEDNISEEVNNWKKQLKKIYAVLDGAMEKQWGNQLVETWVCDLRDLAYDVEDVLDELTTEAQRRKLEEKAEAQRSKVRRIISTVKFSAQMVSKMKSIGGRFQDIFKDKDHLHLGGSGTSHVKERLPTSSMLQESEATIYGRDKDKEKVLQLLKDEANDVNISVVSIIGMGGIGKTTLAQLIYNDTSLEFNFKTWVSVGDDFDVLKITKTILQPAKDDEKSDFNWYQVKLKEKLQRKKCLIVVDDVWNKSYDRWTLFCCPLQGCAPGSKILVTSRDQRVSQMMGSTSVYSLRVLSEEDCLSVFAQHALGVVNFDNHLHLKDIGRGIVRRCRGLPLAAKALGGILRGRPNRDDWEMVLSSNIWDLDDDKCNILPALRLSYFHLPFYLKQCFAYCATFPKDTEFDRNEIVSLWMAEGFVDQPLKMIELGYIYFDDLLCRSFFQVSSSDKSQYVMHDLMHDLAQSVSGETCFHLGQELRSTDQHSMIRHSSFMSGYYNTWKKFEGFSEMKNLRTFLALPIMPKYGYKYLTSKVLHDMVPKMRSLRALSLAGYHIVELPSSIGELKRLRYLNFSYSKIKRLPESVVDLLNLQTLRLRGCGNLIELPMDMGKLINLQILDVRGCWKLSKLPLCISSLTNLQSLDVSDTNALQGMPPQIGNLRNLKMLTKFIVGKEDGVTLKELKELSKLEGKLCMVDLQNVVDMRDAEIADLKEKHGIEELELEWGGSSINPSDEEVEVLNSLRPNQNVSRLSIKGFGGSEFTSWIVDPTFNKMVKLTLCSCKNITRLPPLGQILSLRELSIGGMHRVKEVGVELYGNGSSCFVSLETLIIENMQEWERWSYSNEEEAAVIFPKLSDLKVLNCPKLVGKLPMSLPSLRKLHIEGCQEILLRSTWDFPSLTHLEIRWITGLVSLDETHIEDMVALQHLVIAYCVELLYLWKDGTNLERLASLRSISIYQCKQLVSLVEGEEGKLPCNLQDLSMYNCDNLEKLANGLHGLTCLRELKIFVCDKLKSFPGRGVPNGLKILHIFGCRSLECLPEGIIFGNEIQMTSQPQLEVLIIRECLSLICPQNPNPNEHFPNSLIKMELECSNWPTELFECVYKIMSASPNGFSHLTKLVISNCAQLEHFPEEVHTLTSLSIFNCENLRSLPHNLSSLRDLFIDGCNNFRCLPSGMPNLTYLTISNCKNLKQPMSEWGLHTLTSLESLEIRGTIPSTDMLDSFPDNDNDGIPLLLPTSLEILSISEFKNLKIISRGILNLTSLRCLEIEDCPNLRSFPKEGFPPTLEKLWINRCPLIEEWCLKHRNDHVSIISHIPCVEIDWKVL